MLKPMLPGKDSRNIAPMQISIPCATLLILTLVACYLPVLTALVSRWNSDAQYSHGFLVPLFAAYIAWNRKDEITSLDGSSSAAGLICLLVGMATYIAGAAIYFDWLTQASLLPVLWGIAWILGGRRMATIALPGILYLLFMIPLPYVAEAAMAQPLQKVAGVCSTYLLQTVGFAAYRSGNLINVEGHVLGVAEACSGLHMLVVFFALATALALVTERHWLQKFILVCSAAAIALLCNVLRITATGALYVYAGAELADAVFHDLAGWLMMPLALLMMWAELKYLQLLFDDSWGSRSIVNEQPVRMFSSPA